MLDLICRLTGTEHSKLINYYHLSRLFYCLHLRVFMGSRGYLIFIPGVVWDGCTASITPNRHGMVWFPCIDYLGKGSGFLDLGWEVFWAISGLLH